MSNVLPGIFFLLFLAALVGVIKPYKFMPRLRRWHYAIAALVFFAGIGIVAPQQPAQQTKLDANSVSSGTKDDTADGVVAANGTCDKSTGSPAPDKNAPASNAKSTPGDDAATAGNKYFVRGDALQTGPCQTKVTIQTNIPGTVRLSVGLMLRNLRDNDLAIGASKFVTIKDGAGSTIFDTSKYAKGAYQVEVDYYPNWGPQDDKAKQSDATKELHFSKPVSIMTSSVPADELRKKDALRTWIMQNLLAGDSWNAGNLQAKLGTPEELPIVNTPTESPIKAFYFPVPDMTLDVDTASRKILGYDDGKTTKSASARVDETKITPRDITGLLKDAVEDSVKGNLKDPYSAVFSGLYGVQLGTSTVTVCGNVNAKNGFGGYVGETSFVTIVGLTPSGDISTQATTFLNDGKAAFKKLWATCSKA